MASEIERSHLQVALAAARHSQRHQLSNYSLNRLSNQQVIDIGAGLVRLFEWLYEEEIKKASPGDSETPSTSGATQRLRHRPRGQ